MNYLIQLTPANLPTGTTFSWPDPDGSGPATARTNVAMGAPGTLHILDFLPIHLALDRGYLCGDPDRLGGCAGTPQNIAITVNPTPVLATPQAKTICSGANTSYEILLNPVNQPAGTTFSWPDPDGTGPASAGVNIPMGVAGTAHIQDVLTNTTGAPIIVNYVVTPSLGSCSGTAVTVAITVNPAPVLVTPQAKTIVVEIRSISNT